MNARTITYCDYNAGAPVRPEAAVAVARALQTGANPSSIHSAGRAAKKLLEDARERVGAAIGARVENLVFTSGATEALHLALAGAGAASVIVSAAEHDACFAQASAMGARVAPVTGDGAVDLVALEALIADAPKPALVCVMLANNETGAIQPIARVAALAREHGALLLVDAAQALGRVAVSIADLDASYLVVSSHKIGGPAGAGALALAPGAPFRALHAGGGQERGRRPGTENVAALSGFGVAAEIAAAHWETEAERVRALRDRFEAALTRDAVIFGAPALPPVAAKGTGAPLRLPNTSLFALPDVRAETAVIALDLDGVCVSSGAACSSGKVRESRVLKAMGVESALAQAALRVSFGWASNEADCDAVIAAVGRLAARRKAAA